MRFFLILVCVIVSGCASMNQVGDDGLTGHQRLAKGLQILGGGMKGCPNPEKPCVEQQGRQSVFTQSSRLQTTCFKRKEYTTAQTKQCVYDCLGQTHIMTIPSYELCPITIDVD